MAPLSSILAGRIPWTEEPGGLRPVRSQSAAAKGTEHTCLHKVRGKCTALESSLNHPPTPGLWKNCLPRNWSVVPKGWWTTDTRHVKDFEFYLRGQTLLCFKP